MKDDIYVVRGMLANNAMDKLWDKTRKLYDTFGLDGAILYLETQKKFLNEIHELESVGEDFGNEL